jgi:hypothetical protein
MLGSASNLCGARSVARKRIIPLGAFSPKQNKPCMPIVGMATDGLGFYSSHFSKPLSNKLKRSFIGLVKIVEGVISAEDLEKDFGFHFPWAVLGKPPSVTLVS